MIDQFFVTHKLFTKFTGLFNTRYRIVVIDDELSVLFDGVHTSRSIFRLYGVP